MQKGRMVAFQWTSQRQVNIVSANTDSREYNDCGVVQTLCWSFQRLPDALPAEWKAIFVQNSFYDRGGFVSSTPLKEPIKSPDKVSPPPSRGVHCTEPSSARPYKTFAYRALNKCSHDKKIAKAFSKSRIRKRAAAKACDGDLSLWDEWLRVQIEYYKVKRELAKEQLLQLKSRPAAE
ncbi:hypothetical protein PoB_005451100 [Plakobranchus ocellatus]|uniref:Uncharacterized protein n=1 Tax=Plakobranchus ocellatus TaxID=259542 RepID=A0AAV4C9L5_9GAST|nr:hypothetical protein PoB_005451100 [Plakobranchus ocellatus]